MGVTGQAYLDSILYAEGQHLSKEQLAQFLDALSNYLKKYSQVRPSSALIGLKSSAGLHSSCHECERISKINTSG